MQARLMMSRREGRRKNVAKLLRKNKSKLQSMKTSSTGTTYSVVGLVALAKEAKVVRQSYLTR